MNSSKIIYYNKKDIQSLKSDEDYELVFAHKKYMNYILSLIGNNGTTDTSYSLNIDGLFNQLIGSGQDNLLIDISGFYSQSSQYDPHRIQQIVFYAVVEKLLTNNFSLAIDIEFLLEFEKEFRELIFNLDIQEYIPKSYNISFYSEEFKDKFDEFCKSYVGNPKLKNLIREIVESKRYKKVKVINLMFFGLPGTGKTFFGQELSNVFWQTAPIKINLGNYSTEGSINSLIGSPKGYIGSDTMGELVEKISKQKSKIIIFDEFDKAHKTISNFLHQLLDEGKFSDNFGVEHNLNDYMIIFTSNILKPNKNDVPKSLQSRTDLLYLFSDYNNDELIRIAKKYLGSEYEDGMSLIKDNQINECINTDVRVMKKCIDKKYAILKANQMKDHSYS